MMDCIAGKVSWDVIEPDLVGYPKADANNKSANGPVSKDACIYPGLVDFGKSKIHWCPVVKAARVTKDKILLAKPANAAQPMDGSLGSNGPIAESSNNVPPSWAEYVPTPKLQV